ncbi:MAG: hypothetical protein H0V73_07785 [Chloroflexi bacterium]|nr:hypothetical protein [Chloroflexota bacterium]
MTDRGELIVLQSHLVGVGDTLSLFDPISQTVTPIVARPTPSSQDAATSQIGGATGNADWIVWEESGFVLEHADWTMWAMDRATGRVAKVASFEPGPNGKAVPGFASDVSLSGSAAAWSAPGPSGQRITIADLRAGTHRELQTEARWPSMTGGDALIAAVRAGTDAGSGKVLSQPTTIGLRNDQASPVDWIEPARLQGLASSSAGSVAVRLVKEATPDDPVTVAEVVTHDAAGAIGTFPLPNDWGPPAAGTGFLAWTDQRHLWVLPSGRAEPTMLLQIADDGSQIAVIANGSWIYWRTLGFGDPWASNRVATVTC